AAPRRLACRQIAARMRLSLDLHHPQRRAAIARDGDRNAGATVGGGSGEMRRSQPRFARGGTGGGVLGDAAAKGRSDVGRGRPAATEEPCRGGAAANGWACADKTRRAARGTRKEQDRHKK